MLIFDICKHQKYINKKLRNETDGANIAMFSYRQSGTSVANRTEQKTTKNPAEGCSVMEKVLTWSPSNFECKLSSTSNIILKNSFLTPSFVQTCSSIKEFCKISELNCFKKRLCFADIFCSMSRKKDGNFFIKWFRNELQFFLRETRKIFLQWQISLVCLAVNKISRKLSFTIFLLLEICSITCLKLLYIKY